MRTKLTQKMVDALKPKVAKYDVNDTELKGLCVRVMPSGSTAFYVRYWTVGKQKWFRLADARVVSVEQARTLAKKALSRVADGADVQEERKTARGTMTLRAFLEGDYGAWLETNRKSGHYMKSRLLSAGGPLLDKTLLELTPWLIEKWASAIRRKGKNVTANRLLAYLKAALARAKSWGLVPENAAGPVKKTKEDTRARIRYLSPEEEARLFGALDAREERMRSERDSANQWRQERSLDILPDLRRVHFADYLLPMVLLALNCGLRRGELFGLTWDDIDFPQAVVTVRGEVAKSASTRHIPLNTTALETLRQWRGQSPGDGLVFPGRTGARMDNIKKSWAGIMTAAHITTFRFHDLRHHFASALVMRGADLNTVRELLGHGDIKMTLRYAHLAPSVKRDAVAKLDQPTNIIALGATVHSR